MKTNQMEKNHKTYLRRYIDSAWRKNADYKKITNKMNDKFGTKFTIYQVAGFLGRQIQLGN